MKDAVSTFVLKSEVMIVTSRDGLHVPTEVKNVITYVTQAMVDSHYEILWSDTSGADLGCHPTENYGAALDDPAKQSIISQQHLRSKMIGLYINNLLKTDSKRKLR